MATTKETPGTGSVTDMWKNKSGGPTARATGGWADGTSKKPQGRGKRWRAYYVKLDGRKKYQSFDNKDEAQAWVNNRCAEINEGRYVDPALGRNLFGEIAQEWLAALKPVKGQDGRWRGPIEPKTYNGYERHLRLYLTPRWGTTPIRDINYAELLAWFSQLGANGSQKSTGLSASQVRQIKIALGRIFKYAIKKGLVQSDPTALIERNELPRQPQAKKPVALNHAELQALAADMGELEVMTLVLGYCGLRISEAVGLKRKDIVGQTLHVEEVTAYATGFGLHDKDTKSHRRRIVPIPEPIWEVFEPTLPTDSDAYIFPFEGKQMRDHNYKYRLKMAVKRMQERTKKLREREIADTGQSATREFPRITPHNLRDTFASLAISHGANVKVLQKLLGHASAAMTLDIYADFFPEDIDAVAQALSAAIKLPPRQSLGQAV